MASHLTEELKSLRDKGLYRLLKSVDGEQGPEVTFKGKSFLNFSSNNYLGLANHPALKKAASVAALKYGTGSGASRLITGSMSLHHELEEEIASFKGTESALLFNSGYHANIGIISSLMGEGDQIFSDELNHASLIDGCRLSKAGTTVYWHCDMKQLEQSLQNPPQPPFSKGGGTAFSNGKLDLPPVEKGGQGGFRRLIITDTVFSMDGDLCPLPEIMALAEKQDAMVLVDEAHATGVFGKKGRGVVEHFGIDSRHPRLIQMGTLGKALGSFGAYVCGPRELTEFLVNKARSFIYTTSLPPAVCAASLAAVRLVERDSSLKEKLWENIRYFGDHFKKSPQPPFFKGGGIQEGGNTQRGMNLPPFEKGGLGGFSPIFPVIIGDAKKTMELSEKLFEQGIWAQGIRPPTVKEGTARIRLTLMATHTKEHLDRCLTALQKCGIEI
ncbi:MAG: 8-amino-7-oxononanoate synthase [Deltaproteobacteria bacterium]|nr:8-amino-7-oxononanoate synthase [Deltaproteobacteria bacterium]